jgi:hypothetical protein
VIYILAAFCGKWAQLIQLQEVKDLTTAEGNEETGMKQILFLIKSAIVILVVSVVLRLSGYDYFNPIPVVGVTPAPCIVCGHPFLGAHRAGAGGNLPRAGQPLVGRRRKREEAAVKELDAMKEGIHPKYVKAEAICACGNTFETGPRRRNSR